MPFGTKAEVLAVLAGDGWFARYDQGEEPYDFVPLVAFIVTRHSTGRIETVGLIADERASAKGERADKWPNFDGYTRG